MTPQEKREFDRRWNRALGYTGKIIAPKSRAFKPDCQYVRVNSEVLRRRPTTRVIDGSCAGLLGQPLC